MARNTPFPQQLEKATTEKLSSMTGVVGELVYDTDKKTVVPMDGATAGGHPVALAERKIVSATTGLIVNDGTEATLASDITLKLSGVVGDQTWGVAVAGKAPVEQAEIDALVADKPHAAYIYFSEDGLYQVLKPEGGTASLLRVDSCCDDTQAVLDQANEALELARQYAQGKFVVVSDPVFSLPAFVSPSSTLSITMRAEAYLDNQSIAKFILSCPELSIESIDVPATANTALYELVIPASAVAATVYHVIIKAVDTVGNVSRPVELATTVGGVSTSTVAVPSIVSPVNGSAVYSLARVTLIGSPFIAIDDTGTHSGSDWKITTDTGGNDITVSVENIASLTQHVFTGLSLTLGGTYYAFVRYRSSTGAVSAWSAASSFVPEAADVEVVEGVGIARHPTEPGSVLSWYDTGTASNVNLLVFDAVRRTINLAWDSQNPSTASGLPLVFSVNIQGNMNITGDNQSIAPADAAKMSMRQFNALWPANTLDPNTATYNCSVWERLGLEHLPCLSYVRNITTLTGERAVVPNIQQLMRIYSAASVLDAYDSSVSSYPTRALTGWFNSTHALVWASTEHAATSERCMINHGGTYTAYYKYYTNNVFVLPVFELN